MNNAGVGAFGPMTQTDARAEAEMVALNCVAVAHLTHALVPGLLKRARNWNKRSGLIVVASTAALHPLPYLSTYAATKAFDYFLAEGLAAELAGDPLDVLTLCPGPTETRFFERAGGFDQTSIKGWLTGGWSGPPVVPGRPGASSISGAGHAYCTLERQGQRGLRRPGGAPLARQETGLGRGGRQQGLCARPEDSARADQAGCDKTCHGGIAEAALNSDL